MQCSTAYDTTRVTNFSHHIAALLAAPLPLPTPAPRDFVLLPFTAVHAAEEFALHMIIKMAEASEHDGEGAGENTIDRLPQHTG
jgi:hypothetical protein